MTEPLNKRTIDFFLHLGYFPEYQEQYPLDLSGIKRNKYQKIQHADVIREGASLFREAISRSFIPGKRHLVPISGGLDSRAILSALLEHTDAQNIETYTFGTPNTLDYQIGTMVAETAGTSHTTIDLTSVSWSLDDLYETAKKQDGQTFLFHHVPAKRLEHFKTCIIWSGYIGDAITGGHLKTKPSPSLDTAHTSYLKSRSEIQSINALYGNVNDLKIYLGGGNLPPEVLTYDEQVLFAEVGSVTAPHVMPHGFTYQTPFINNRFMDFFLSLPDNFRYNQNGFVSMLRTTWPNWFEDLPTKTHYGFKFNAPRWQIQKKRASNRILRFLHDNMGYLPLPPHPGINFINYNDALRRNTSFQTIIRQCMDHLKSRDIVDHIDIETLWSRHMNGSENHGDVFKILASLEINLGIRS